jgi:alginate O-acetyltransferase complex protein AlgJ
MELLERAETPGNSNDLGSLLPLAQRSNYPAESQMIRRPAPTKGRDGLLDNDRSDVAVVGNSFVQPKYNFAPMLSSKLGRPVTLTWQVHTFGPYRTLTDYLKGSEFRQQRPKLLVLNLLEQAINLLPSNKNAFPSGFMSVDEFLSTIRKAVA